MRNEAEMSIEETVREALAGKSHAYLEEIVDHGIHNITNNFQGENDEEYEEFSEEFDRQARQKMSGDDTD